MDPFLIYLIAVNVVAFAAFAFDYLLCRWKPEIEDTAANAIVMDIFPLAGGAVGTLAALFVLTGRDRRRRMNKDNVAWWFLAIVCLIVWALIAAAKFGLVTLNGGLGALFTGWQLGRLKVLGIYLAVASLITFGVFAWDKHVAAKGDDHGRRVPEACLLGLSLAGGALGGLLAMHVVRHKTQKWYFVWGLPVIMVVDAVLILYVHLCGLV